MFVKWKAPLKHLSNRYFLTTYCIPRPHFIKWRKSLPRQHLQFNRDLFSRRFRERVKAQESRDKCSCGNEVIFFFCLFVCFLTSDNCAEWRASILVNERMWAIELESNEFQFQAWLWRRAISLSLRIVVCLFVCFIVKNIYFPEFFIRVK